MYLGFTQHLWHRKPDFPVFISSFKVIKWLWACDSAHGEETGSLKNRYSRLSSASLRLHFPSPSGTSDFVGTLKAPPAPRPAVGVSKSAPTFVSGDSWVWTEPVGTNLTRWGEASTDVELLLFLATYLPFNAPRWSCSDVHVLIHLFNSEFSYKRTERSSNFQPFPPLLQFSRMNF